MWSLEAIDYVNQEAAKQARRNRQEPYVPSIAEVEDYPPFPFPNLGPFVPNGWERLEATWFVDHSGFGKSWEPALTPDQFRELLQHYVGGNPDHGFGIVEVNQFQLYVGAFKRK